MTDLSELNNPEALASLLSDVTGHYRVLTIEYARRSDTAVRLAVSIRERIDARLQPTTEQLREAYELGMLFEKSARPADSTQSLKHIHLWHSAALLLGDLTIGENGDIVETKGSKT